MFRLALTLTVAEGALLRALGTIERRGFRIADIACRGQPGALTVDLDVEGPRPTIEVLLRQLHRLRDVRAATLAPPRDAAPPTPRRPAPTVPPEAIGRRSLSFLGIPDPAPREVARP